MIGMLGRRMSASDSSFPEEPGGEGHEFNQAHVGATHFLQESYPPTTLSNNISDSRQLLDSWAHLVSEQAPDMVGIQVFRAVKGEEDWLPESWHPDQASGENWQEMAGIVHKMKYAIDIQKYLDSMYERRKNLVKDPVNSYSWQNLVKNSATPLEMHLSEISSGHLEAVGLVPKGVAVLMGTSTAHGASSNESSAPTSALDTSVHAFALISRRQLQDDSWCSLRWIAMVDFAEFLTSPWSLSSAVDVFALDGLVGAPNLPLRSAKVLLSKISRWAQVERKLLVVLPQALALRDGTDLTAYYRRLGFRKVGMEDGTALLVYYGFYVPANLYDGTAAPANSSVADASTRMDQWFEDQHNMVGLKL